jgi:hypothetical protein
MGYSDKLSKFEVVLLLRMLRPDKVRAFGVKFTELQSLISFLVLQGDKLEPSKTHELERSIKQHILSH